MNGKPSYLMENLEEALRLEIKTDPEAIREQARWCGLRPGQRLLDAGCGPGKTTAILRDMIQPGGVILGVDYSKERIDHAREHYGSGSEIDFRLHDLREPPEGVGSFDLIWVRFVLEYNRKESQDIVRNLTACLNPGGHLCLLDLDRNCLNHYELPRGMERMLFKVMDYLEERHNFDPYAGRKLYAHLFDLGFENIQLDLRPHHLFYGDIEERDLFNWVKKGEVASDKTQTLFEEYPGGHEAFYEDFKRFFTDP
jgi:SAM-dependent methyltransferase